jgi:hypothetical protein
MNLHSKTNNIKYTLKNIPRDIGAILCPSFNFILQNKVQQSSMIKSLTKASLTNRTWKTIARVQSIVTLNVHSVTLFPWCKYVDSYYLKQIKNKKNYPLALNNKQVHDALIKINHYQYQSLDYHNNIVVPRGRATCKHLKRPLKTKLDDSPYEEITYLKDKVLTIYPSLYNDIPIENQQFNSQYPKKNILMAIEEINIFLKSC